MSLSLELRASATLFNIIIITIISCRFMLQIHNFMALAYLGKNIKEMHKLYDFYILDINPLKVLNLVMDFQLKSLIINEKS